MHLFLMNCKQDGLPDTEFLFNRIRQLFMNDELLGLLFVTR